jgi:hypothetical protein
LNCRRAWEEALQGYARKDETDFEFKKRPTFAESAVAFKDRYSDLMAKVLLL